MFIAQWRGQGHGFMAGVTEYITLFDDQPAAEDLEPAPGFELTQVLEVDVVEGDQAKLPTDQVLVPRF